MRDGVATSVFSLFAWSFLLSHVLNIRKNHVIISCSYLYMQVIICS